MTTEVMTLRLTADAARALTDEAKGDAAALWRKLLTLYEGEAHLALRFKSWAAYCEAEFDWSDATAYRLLQSARVVGQLPMGSSGPTTERVARELVPVLKQAPERVPEVWGEVVELHGPEPTAAQVREVVQPRKPTRPVRRQVADESNYPAMFNNVLDNTQSAASHAASLVAVAVRAETDPRKLADWLEVTELVLAELRTIRKEIRKGTNA